MRWSSISSERSIREHQVQVDRVRILVLVVAMLVVAALAGWRVSRPRPQGPPAGAFAIVTGRGVSVQAVAIGDTLLLTSGARLAAGDSVTARFADGAEATGVVGTIQYVEDSIPVAYVGLSGGGRAKATMPLGALAGSEGLTAVVICVQESGGVVSTQVDPQALLAGASGVELQCGAGAGVVVENLLVAVLLSKTGDVAQLRVVPAEILVIP
jgi:hypothetical protein